MSHSMGSRSDAPRPPLWGEQDRHARSCPSSPSTSTRRPASAARRARSPARSGTTCRRVPTTQTGTYQTMPDARRQLLEPDPLQRAGVRGRRLAWLMRKDQCMHCEDPGCLAACPAPGAIVQYDNGIVDVNPDACIGCGYCETGCPFDVPRFHAKTDKMAKCTLCVDRVAVGLEPACIKACPTGCLQFGTKDDMVALGKRARRAAQGERLRERRALRSAGRGRHGRRHRARARRPSRVVRAAEGSARAARRARSGSRCCGRWASSRCSARCSARSGTS